MVDIVPEEQRFDVIVMRRAIEDEPLNMSAINVDEAAAYTGHPVSPDDIVPYKLSTAKFGRVAAQTAKQAIRTEIKTYEREKYISQFEGKLQEAVSATVQRIDPKAETLR